MTYPLRKVLHKSESSGRMLKWAMKLGQFDLEYMPRTTIKGQALANFLLEFDSESDDGAVNNGGAGAGIVLVSLEGHHVISVIHFKFYATNNNAEYEALINGLKITLEMGVQNMIAKSYSELVVNQVNGGFQEKNINVDAMEKMGSQQEAVLLGSISLEIEEIHSIPEVEVMQVDEAPKETWMTHIIAYIYKGTLPEDKFKARQLRYQAARICGNHSGGNSLAIKVLRQGYYWPTMKEDATNFVRACDRCQRFANYSSMPAKLLTPIRFDSKELRQLCEDLKIKKESAAVYHPQSNGQTEAVNKIIKHTLKTKLYEHKGNWPKELPKVLWSYNTTPRSTTGESPFMLTYGYEAMVLVEVGSGSLRRDCYVEEDAEVNQRLHFDIFEETRENSQLRLAEYQQGAARYYNKKVNGQLLRVGDLLLRKVMPNTKNPYHGVFGANWKGPYKIKAILWKGTYHLEDLEGKLVPRAWNAEHLRKYYQ
ncbi:uncharacterized protein LOC141694879 [Apium graveolens]|uniref:uncharacterized protein LOC141694879 n=1 Tax=Apium graveolens TaxID=4045 RepID=UPI003D7C0093